MTTPLDHIIAATLPGGLAIASVAAERIDAAIRAHYADGAGPMFAAIRRELELLLPIYAATVEDSLLAAWVAAAIVVAEPVFTHGPPLPLPVLPPNPLFDAARPSVVRLPKIEAAAKWLTTKTPIPPSMFADLSDDAKAGAFTVARAGTTEAVAKIQAALVDSVANGGTLAQFRGAVRSTNTPLSPAAIEGIYRTEVGKAYAAGQMGVLSHPLVISEFPYVLYTATHDSRVREEHLAMESYGIDGGPVYRADDPVIQKFWPPISWNCRCHAISISLEDAASRYGVSEAQEWLRTGVDPKRSYVAHPPFDLPAGWVPVGRGGRFRL